MDQGTVETLLRRLVERVEDSERRYGEALDDLHARLDHLSQTTEAARETGAPEDADTFDRLHTQVSDLARRLETESSTPLDDFERLGQALSGGLRADSEESARDPYGYEPEPSRFAQSVMASKTRSRLAPDSDLAEFGYGATAPKYAGPASPFEGFAPEHANLDKQLVEMAERLEQSIGAAMPASAIEALNTRLDEIGTQIAQSLETVPSGAALEHIERQITDMGQQLTRAEEQLGRIGGVEDHLLKLIARLDEKDAEQEPAALDPAQLQDIAAKAAKDAARLVADDTKKTTERLDAMQRELASMDDRSRQSGDKLASTIEAVHQSLKQLVEQLEHSGPGASPKPRTPFTSPVEAKPAAPFAQAPQQATAPQAQAPKAEAPKTLVSAAPQTSAPKAPETPSPRLPEMRPASKLDDAEMRMKETLRDRLGAAIPDYKETETPPPFGRAKRAGLDGEAVDLDAAPKAAPDDLVAAARRAAQAAAVRAEERSGRRSKKVLPGSSPATEQPGRRKRSLLIISAAILLAISALLLYGRLGSKPDADMSPTTIIEPAPSADTPSATTETPPADTSEDAAAPESNETIPSTEPDQGSWMILPDQGSTPGPDFEPFNGRVGQATPGVTDVVKSSGGKPSGATMPESEIRPEPQLASLTPTNAAALPPGVIFSIEDPASATDAALAERLTMTPVKGPMPPEALGPLPLRKAASEGDAAAQYTIADRYMEGKGTTRNVKKATEWLERAARAGLAPAQYRLAAMYERGLGVERDLDKARSWYAAAAERGNVKAMHNLAVSVSGRDGSAPDYDLAAKWYGEAAARGLADSQFNLGILAEHGLGRTKSLTDAYKWFSLAAAQGDPEAQKRRDVIHAQLAPETLAAADAEVKAWTAMPVTTEANEVTEQRTWAATSASSPQGVSLVAKAQVLLNKLGFDVGPPDGLMGERTRTGIKLFQQRNGLNETGEVTAPLVTKLESLAS
ncbi:MAG: peptidoglycan-binding protein [Methyloceanibacter sp.]|uniref:peptidoglycan-binding protein n=1 Tax=Methyloceanibacter sp. TaxID=1965321 RepID=UPI003EE33791